MRAILGLTVAMIVVAGGEWRAVPTRYSEVLFLPGSVKLAQDLRPRVDPDLERIAAFLQVKPTARVQVMVTPDLQTFQELQGGQAPDWVSGMAYPEKNLIVLRPLSGREVRQSSQEAVLVHELTHLMLHQKLRGQTPPKWLDEGLAVFMAQEPYYDRAQRLFLIALTSRYIPIRLLQDQFPEDETGAAIAYAESGDFVMFLLRNYGDPAFRHYLDLMAQGQDPDQALQAAYHATLFDLDEKWLHKMRLAYGWFPALSGGGLLWFVISLLALTAYLRRYREVRSARENYEGPAGLSRSSLQPEEIAAAEKAEAEWKEDEEWDEDEDFEEDEDEENGSGWRH